MISVRETNGIGCVNLPKILKEGCEITSSGTTGPPKTIFRTPENLKACNKTAIETQKLTSKSRVLTVARMTHAGGLLTQTLPAFTLDCEIEIIPFNAFSFLKSFKDYTHTVLPPKMVEAIIKTKGFKDCDLSYKTITLGSDPIPWEHISELVEKGATVICNWGMSEIGPCAINKTYDKNNVWETFYESPDLTILGNKTPLEAVKYKKYFKKIKEIINDLELIYESRTSNDEPFIDPRYVVKRLEINKD